MINVDLIKELQKLFNDLWICAYNLKSMKYQFYHHGMFGFSSMASHESHERYSLGKRVASCMQLNAIMPHIKAFGEPEYGFANPLEALDFIIQTDSDITDFAKSVALMANEHGNPQIGLSISEIVNEMMSELEEVKRIRMQVTPVLNDSVKLNELDTQLYYKYAKQPESCCCCCNHHECSCKK